MGMFDNITVPKTYLKSLLTKDQEKLIDRNDFQTKSLDNLLSDYKIYRQKLFLKNDKDQWEKISYSGKVTFYTLFREESNVSHWGVFTFTFSGGTIDRKELITFETHQAQKDIDEMWDTEQKILNAYRTTSLKYKFYAWLEGRFQKMTNWARKKHSLPLEVRTEAYEKSGRLAKDPDCLKLYKDI